jgi:hypothetical protein
MKRGGSLQRKTPLVAKKPMARGKGLKAGAPAKPKARPKTAPKPVVDLVKQRSGGLCEIGILCLGSAPATERAHRMGKGSGGVGKKNTVSNQAANLLDACHEDHARIDNAEVADAERLGLKLRHTIARPNEVPVHLHNHNGWVLLDNNGGVRRAPEAACVPGALLPVITVTAEEYEFSDDGDVFDAVYRWGHADCGGWGVEVNGPCECICGTVLFIVAVSS